MKFQMLKTLISIDIMLTMDHGRLTPFIYFAGEIAVQ